ncbi:MAG TPA: hypothetical protein VMI72_10545 [Roseiarcus sp.]|nr:hypothetical protein [Roseiarcus sp.]
MTSKALVALALVSLLTGPAWSQDASGGFTIHPYQDPYRNPYGETHPTAKADAANPYASSESYGTKLRNGAADPYLSMYRYGTTSPYGLGERYAPSNLYGLKDPSAYADPDLSMYRYGTTNPMGSTDRFGSGDLNADPYGPGTTSDDDPMDAGLSPSGKSRNSFGVSQGGDDESDLAYPYPSLPSASSSSLADAPGGTPSAAGAGETGADGINSAASSAPTGAAGEWLTPKNRASANRAPESRPGGKTAGASGESNAGGPKDAADAALGFNPYDAKSILGGKPPPPAGKATAAAGTPAPPIMGTALPSSVAPASPLPALPASVGPSSVGPSVPGGPSP